MSNIPKDLNDWNIQTIDSLLPILSIEGDSFDFKGNILDKKSEELYNDFCAMSNSLGGTMVLGIRENKAADGTLISFSKEGFEQGKEDIVNQKIANSLHNVDPVPIAPTKLVTDSNQNKFYPIVQIMMIDTNKPYFTKNRGQCYIRVGGHMDNNFNSQTIGAYSHLRELEKLNTYLFAFNTENDISKKIAIKRYLCDSQFWCPERQQARTIIGFLDSLNHTSEEYLSSLNST